MKTELTVLLIDRIALALTILNKLISTGLILAVLHHTLYSSIIGYSCFSCSDYLLARFMILAMNVRRLERDLTFSIRRNRLLT